MIHGREYVLQECECTITEPPEFSPLSLRADVSYLDREVSILTALLENFMECVYIDVHTAYGGYVPCSLPQIGERYVVPNSGTHILHPNGVNILGPLADNTPISFPFNSIIRVEMNTPFPAMTSKPMVIISDNINIETYTKLTISNTNRVLNVGENYVSIVKSIFAHSLVGTELRYDALINLLVMVKNAGDGFEHMLRENIKYVDRLTILDTGSTDNTVSTAKRVLESIDGELYEEPFINFRDSRNRLLELAGEKCTYNLMLDDTYILRGDPGTIRAYLSTTRSDDKADGYSIRIKSTDMEYGSVRLSKSYLKPRYKYTIHEILDCTLSVSLPSHMIWIEDVPSPYMEERTKARKELDLTLLYNELKENPVDTRIPYYLAETYLCLHDYVRADEWYVKTSKGNGYEEEVYDALYKHAVLQYLHLGTNPDVCINLFMDAFRYNPKRYESIFMIGYMKANRGDTDAWTYFQQAWSMGFPVESGMNLKTAQYYTHLPNYLYKSAFERGEYELSFNLTRSILGRAPMKEVNMDEVTFYNHITSLINLNFPYRGQKKKRYDSRRTIFFVIDGGWDHWDGESLRTRGLGGSETSVIRYAETIQANHSATHLAIVFCKCTQRKTYNSVLYIPIQEFIEHVSVYEVDLVLVNRYSEIVPLVAVNKQPHALVLHDLTRDGEYIAPSTKVYCLSNAHANWFRAKYPLVTNVNIYSYGIDRFVGQPSKKAHSFIYSSFPTRGLLYLLQMWERILKKYPSATLNLFCDLEHEWSNRVEPTVMSEVKLLISTHSSTITNHGWVDNITLRKYWSLSHVWLYPCRFFETCCLTAWEASASQTLVVTNHLGALAESVGDRGVIIEGDPATSEWQERCLRSLFEVIDNKKEREYTQRNYIWSLTKAYGPVVREFLDTAL